MKDRFQSHNALSIFREHSLIDECLPETYQGKKYFRIGWCGEDDHVSTVLCVTQVQGEGISRWVPFGLQNDLLLSGVVDEALLFCKHWPYYYRIPAADFRTFTTTIDDGRRLFNVNSESQLSSEGTVSRIDLSPYLKPLAG